MPRSDPNFVMMAADERPKAVDQLRRQALRLLQHAGDAPAAPGAAGADAAAPAPTRAVMVGVVTMPAVFIAVVLGALAVFGKPAADSNSPAGEPIATLEQPAATPALGAAFASAAPRRSPVISLGEDMEIADISLDGDRVALHVESPMGQEILIYDYAKGRIVAAAPIETAAIETVDALAMLTGAPQPPAQVAVAAAPKPAPQVLAEPAPEIAAPPPAPSMKPRTSD